MEIIIVVVKMQRGCLELTRNTVANRNNSSSPSFCCRNRQARLPCHSRWTRTMKILIGAVEAYGHGRNGSGNLQTPASKAENFVAWCGNARMSKG